MEQIIRHEEAGGTSTQCESSPPLVRTLPTLHAPLRFVDEHDSNTRKLGDLDIRFDAGTRHAERVISVSFFFGRTEVTAKAVDESNGGHECRTHFRFAAV